MTARVGTRPASRAATRVASVRPTGVGGEDRPSRLHRGQAVHRLQDEGRGGDVGERDAHREGHHDQVADEPRVAQHLAASRASELSEAAAVAALRRQRLGHTERDGERAWPRRGRRPPRTTPASRSAAGSAAPSSGPTIGATPATPAMRFRRRTSAGPSVRSTTTDRAMTMAQPPLKPCTNRGEPSSARSTG